MDSSPEGLDIPMSVARALVMLDEGCEGGVTRAAEAHGMSRTTLTRWRTRRQKDPAVHRAFMDAKAEIRAERRRERAAKVMDHVAKGGAMFELADVLGVDRSTLYLDLKGVGGVDHMRNLREALALASDIQAFALKAAVQAALVERVPRFLEMIENGNESATVRSALISAMQRLATDEPAGARAPSVQVNTTVTAQAGAQATAVGDVKAPSVDLDQLSDAKVHELAELVIDIAG